MDNDKIWTRDDLISDLRQAGITKGSLLHLKVSMRSIGKIEGGAETLLDAFLEIVGSEGTLVVDSFIPSYPLPLSKEDAKKVSTGTSSSYAGTFANVMIQHPKSVRSKHPIQKFTAIGKLAHQLMDQHLPQSGGYDVFEKLAQIGALNLSVGRNTIGVGTTHVAIDKRGFCKKESFMGVNYLTPEGKIELFQVNWNGGCARGFPKFIPLYEEAGVLRWIKLGNADAALTDMAGTLAVEIQKLKEDPTFFFCEDPTCKDCRLNWSHSTGNYWKVKYHSLVKILGEKMFRK